jgi:D-alanyl-lipoteichoic acid acyltransferase DltB (MBOAT superfamily)
MPTLARARSPYLALNASFFVIGMWHSSTITRLLWELWHSWGSIAYMVWSRSRRKRGWTVFDRRIFVVPAILVGEDSTGFTQGLRVLAKMAFITCRSDVAALSLPSEATARLSPGPQQARPR